MLWLFCHHNAKNPGAHLTYLLKDSSMLCYFIVWRFPLSFIRSNILFPNQNDKVHTYGWYYYTNSLNLFNEINSSPSLRKEGNFERSPRTRFSRQQKGIYIPQLLLFFSFSCNGTIFCSSLWLTDMCFLLFLNQQVLLLQLFLPNC